MGGSKHKGFQNLQFAHFCKFFNELIIAWKAEELKRQHNYEDQKVKKKPQQAIRHERKKADNQLKNIFLKRFLKNFESSKIGFESV